MKMFIVVSLCLTLLLSAHPTTDGTYGLIRAISADNGSAGHFHIGLYTRAFGEKRTVDTFSDSSLGTNALYQGGDLFFNIGYSLTDFLSLNVGGSFLGDNIKHDNSYNRASMGFGDTKIGLKLGLATGNTTLGLYPFVSLPTGEDRSNVTSKKNYPIFGSATGNDGGLFRYFSSGGTDLGALALVTVRSDYITWLVNFGEVARSKNNAHSKGRNDCLLFNASIAWNKGRIAPFIEISGSNFGLSNDTLFGPNPVFVTPGLAFRGGKFNLDLAVDIRAVQGVNTKPFPTALTDSFNVNTGWGIAPPWAVILGISFCHDFITVKPKPGIIAGTIADAKTKLPIRTNIGISRDGVSGKARASDSSGSFTFKLRDPGLYTLQVMKPGYRPFSVELLVKTGETTPINIMLEPLSNEGVLTVNIIDIETRQPVIADVTIGTLITEKDVSKLETILKAGSYRVRAVAKNQVYLPYERNIKIEVGKKLILEVALVKKEFEIILPQVYFETAKATIKPESYPVLDGAAITIRRVFSGNAKISIEVQGHTDYRGSDEYNLRLSQTRAEAVRSYLAARHNIDARRLMARGYGESQPIATNDTPEGMAQNRRVQFVIIGQ